MSIGDNFLRGVSENCQIPVADVLTDPTADTVVADSRPTQFFRFLLSSVFGDEDLRLNSELEDELVVALLCASLSDTVIADKSEPVQRSRAIAKAIEFINDAGNAVVSVRDVCGETGVALRTLNRAFRERFGVGPKAYLVRRRLSRVRAELLRPPADTLITDIANRWGFWHMGQFANDYKAMFGELPSETLRQSKHKIGKGTRHSRID